MLKWSPSPDKGYGSQGEVLFLGDWLVARIGWDGVNRTENEWIVYILLPGIKSQLTIQYRFIEDAKVKAENVVKYWIERASLREAEDGYTS